MSVSLRGEGRGVREGSRVERRLESSNAASRKRLENHNSFCLGGGGMLEVGEPHTSKGTPELRGNLAKVHGPQKRQKEGWNCETREANKRGGKEAAGSSEKRLR